MRQPVWPRRFAARYVIIAVLLSVGVTIVCLPFDIAQGRPIVSSAVFLALMSFVLGSPFALLIARSARAGDPMLWGAEGD